MKELGPLADRVQVIFITVDPERDTAELMAQYPPAFDPRFWVCAQRMKLPW